MTKERNTPQDPTCWLEAARHYLEEKGITADVGASDEDDLDKDDEGQVWLQAWIRVPKEEFDEASARLGEEAHERWTEEYYGGPSPVTDEERYQAAAAQKRELDR